MHLIFIDDGVLKQTADIEGVPAGVEYWEVTSAEKEWMDTNRDKREAWTWTASRAADGVGA